MNHDVVLGQIIDDIYDLYDLIHRDFRLSMAHTDMEWVRHYNPEMTLRELILSNETLVHLIDSSKIDS